MNVRIRPELTAFKVDVRDTSVVLRETTIMW